MYLQVVVAFSFSTIYFIFKKTYCFTFLILNSTTLALTRFVGPFANAFLIFAIVVFGTQNYLDQKRANQTKTSGPVNCLTIVFFLQLNPSKYRESFWNDDLSNARSHSHTRNGVHQCNVRSYTLKYTLYMYHNDILLL